MPFVFPIHARAMALVPSVLLLDEAFEGLAPVVVQRFAEAVRQIKAMGISVLIAEANIVNAAKVADRLYAIDRGDIIFEGPPQAVFDHEEVMKTIRGSVLCTAGAASVAALTRRRRGRRLAGQRP